jgi:hypothetical protein
MGPTDRAQFAALRDSNLKTARAWALKVAMMAFFSYFYERPARKHFRWWHNWATRSRLRPMIEKARMIKRRFDNIVTYLKHRITNAASESINSKIQWVNTPPADFATKSTSSPPSIFIAANWISCLPPTEIPECLQLEGWITGSVTPGLSRHNPSRMASQIALSPIGHGQCSN